MQQRRVNGPVEVFATVAGPMKPLGYVQLKDADITAAANLTVPAGATIIEFITEAQAVRYTDDGTTTPTATVGMPVAVGTLFRYSGDLTAIKFIRQAAGAILNISFYG